GGTEQGTSENADKGEPAQPLADLTRVLLPAFIQRQVGSTRVLVGVGPGCVAVPGEVEPWQIGWHGLTPGDARCIDIVSIRHDHPSPSWRPAGRERERPEAPPCGPEP